MKRITASYFRTHCYAVLRDVENTLEPVIVTKRGKPVVLSSSLDAGEIAAFDRQPVCDPTS